MDKNKIDEHFQHIDKKRGSSAVETSVMQISDHAYEMAKERLCCPANIN